MKKLVITYSHTGNSRFIAEEVAGALGADLLEVKPVQELKGAMAYVVGGYQSIKKKQPEILPLDKDPADYDLIVIGTPVWAHTYAPVLHTFLVSAALKGKKIALFCCYGNQVGHTLEDLKKQLEGNEIVAEIDFRTPLTRDKEMNAEKARAWAAKINQG